MVFQAIWGLSFFKRSPFGKRFLWGIDCGRRYVSLLGPIMGGAGKYCACAVAANGQLGCKEGGRKNPRIFMGWFDQADFFFRKKKNQAFWRKWWLDTLVEHYNNHAIGWLVFLEGKREISQLFASSMIFDHPSQMLIVAQVCLLPSKPCRGRTAHFSTYQTGGTHRHRRKRGDEWGELFVSLRWEYEGYLH